MKVESEFFWSAAKASADRVLSQTMGQYLNDREVKVLHGAWEGKTYDQMADLYGYSAEYLNKDVGNKLWRKLSEALGETVTKKNFREALQRSWEQQQSRSTPNFSFADVPFPSGSVPLNSPFYLERPGIDSRCYDAILKPHAWILIQSPQLMGKTSLITRILDYSTRNNAQTLYLDMNSLPLGIFTDLDKFLRWFCGAIARQLKLDRNVNDYWDTEILGSSDSCTVYWEEYLLTQLDRPVVLALDNLERIFDYPDLRNSFLGMLRSWHEKGKISELWKKLRLVMAYSTEVNLPGETHQFLLNAGMPVKLPEFDDQQIQDLARLHQLNWSDRQLETLTNLVGGHPYLIRLAMYEVSCGNIGFDQFLQDAPTEAGIYNHYLRGYLEKLQQFPELAVALKQAIASSEPIELESRISYQLYNLGLVQRQHNHIKPSCHLYREYFGRVLKQITPSESFTISTQLPDFSGFFTSLDRSPSNRSYFQGNNLLLGVIH
jgi:hypothetical protein